VAKKPNGTWKTLSHIVDTLSFVQMLVDGVWLLGRVLALVLSIFHL